jgi:PAS domain S-box-containing protein
MLTRCSTDLRYRFVSAAYADMLGTHAADIVGRPIIDVMGEEGWAGIQPYVTRVLAGERVEYESEVHFKGVGHRPLRVVYTPDRDCSGHVQGWIASILDISDGSAPMPHEARRSRPSGAPAPRRKPQTV